MLSLSDPKIKKGGHRSCAHIGGAKVALRLRITCTLFGTLAPPIWTAMTETAFSFCINKGDLTMKAYPWFDEF